MTKMTARKGNRLSKIVTKTGDDGTTGISGKTRLPKFHSRIEAIGLVDELNSLLGVGLAHLRTETLQLQEKLSNRESLENLKSIANEWLMIQHHLFNVGGELSMPDTTLVDGEILTKIEALIEHYNEQLPPLKEFILPGGSLLVAQTHLIRAFARKVERALWELNSAETLNPNSIKLLNRLSDYFFVIARTLAKLSETDEVLWQKDVL